MAGGALAHGVKGPGASRAAGSRACGKGMLGALGCCWVLLVVVVTPKGVPLPALCHARATREGS